MQCLRFPSASLSVLIPVLPFLLCCSHHTVEQQEGFLGRRKSRASVHPSVVSPPWKDKCHWRGMGTEPSCGEEGEGRLGAGGSTDSKGEGQNAGEQAVSLPSPPSPISGQAVMKYPCATPTSPPGQAPELLRSNHSLPLRGTCSHGQG